MSARIGGIAAPQIVRLVRMVKDSYLQQVQDWYEGLHIAI